MKCAEPYTNFIKEKTFSTFLAVIFVFTTLLSAQQDEIIFERLNTSNGLSNNAVSDIIQDSKGYLWIGTRDGLNKYDGYELTNYRFDPQDTSSLSNNSLWGITEDKNGNIWIGTEDGLNLYNKKNDSFKTFRYSTGEEQWRNAVTDPLFDEDGNIWFGSVFNGLGKFNPATKKFTHYLPDSANAEVGLPNGIIWIVKDSIDKNRFWLGLWQNGFYSFNIQTEKFTRYKHNPENPDGLSFDFIRSLYQDRKGNVWIGTLGEGLDIFDPRTEKFTHIKHDPKDKNSLSNNTIRSLLEDPDDQDIMWIGTENGLNKYNTNTKTFTIYKSDVNDLGSLSNGQVNDIYINRSGVTWLGTNGGLNKIDPGRVPFHNYSHNPDVPDALNSSHVYAICKSKTGKDVLWIGTYDGGLNRFDRTTKTFTYYKRDVSNPYSISSDSIRSLYEDPDEAGEILWVGTANGLNRFDIKKNRFKTYKYSYNDPTTISSNLLRKIYKTRDGMLWLATSGGLNKFDRRKEIFTRYLPQDSTYVMPVYNLIKNLMSKQKPLAKILQVKDFEDRTQKFELSQKTRVLMVAMGEGTGGMWDYGWLETSDSVEIWKLEEDKSKHAGGGNKNRLQIWAGTLEAGSYNLRYISDDSHSFENWNVPQPIHPEMWGIQIFALNDKQNTLITQNINKVEKPSSISGSSISAILEDSYGMLWVGSQDKGLSRLDRKTDKFTNFLSDPANPNSINSNFILCLHEDKNGTLWVGTRDGLNKYDPESGSFKSYTIKDGLPNNAIINIVEDANGSLWLATNNGISKVNPDENSESGHLTFINYNLPDGLQFNNYYIGSYYSAPDGEMFFGGSSGFVSFFPGKTNPQPPRTIISNFLVFNRPVVPGEDSPLQKSISETKNINLPYDKNAFSFEFVALHFSRPEKNQYLYKMEGFDKDWIDGNRRFAPYTNLDPGDYTFRVKASNSDGVWNEEGVSLEITILPPWWRTWWAYGSYVLFLALAVFSLDRFQRRRLLSKARERMKLQEAEHRAESAELQARAVQAENERKTRELEEARALQLSMLPKELPQLPNLDIAVYMQTATEVGGDYYDFHVSIDGTLTVVIGDATGHGMKAGTMVTTAKSLFNSYAPNPDILYSFQEITRCIKQMNFGKLSMCMTMLKIKGDKMQISTAGMPPSFIFRRDTRVVEEHLFQAMPLGTMDNFPYEIKDSTLKPGDTILLMSDGLPELANNGNEMYGYKRIRSGFEDVAEKKPEDIINYFKNEGAGWVNNADPDDDVTFVIIQVK